MTGAVRALRLAAGTGLAIAVVAALPLAAACRGDQAEEPAAAERGGAEPSGSLAAAPREAAAARGAPGEQRVAVPGSVEPPGAPGSTGAAAAPPSGSFEPSAADQAALEQATVTLEQLGALAEKGGARCDRAATAMASLIEHRRAILERAELLGRDPAVARWADEVHGPRLEAARSKLMPLLERCADHEAMAAVLAAID